MKEIISYVWHKIRMIYWTPFLVYIIILFGKEVWRRYKNHEFIFGELQYKNEDYIKSMFMPIILKNEKYKPHICGIFWILIALLITL